MQTKNQEPLHAPIKIKGPKLSPEARAAIQRIMDWEDNSYRSIMGEDPPRR